MAENRTIKLLLEAGVDRNKAQEAARLLDGFSDSTKRAEQTLQRFRDLSIKVGVFKEFIADLENARDESAKLRQELERLNNTNVAPGGGAMSSNLLQRGSTTLMGLGQFAGSGPVGDIIRMSGDIAGTIDDFKDLQKELGSLREGGIAPLLKSLGPNIVALGAVGVAFAGVSAAIDQFNKAAEERTKQIQQYADALVATNLLVAGGATEEDLKKKIADNEAIRRGLVQSQSDLEADILRKQADFAKSLVNSAGNIFATAILTLSYKDSIGGLMASLDDVKKKITDLDFQTNGYTQALGENKTAVNDFVESARNRFTQFVGEGKSFIEQWQGYIKEGLDKAQKDAEAYAKFQNDMAKMATDKVQQYLKVSEQISALLADRQATINAQAEQDAISNQRNEIEAQFAKRITEAKAADQAANDTRQREARIKQIRDDAKKAEQSAFEDYSRTELKNLKAFLEAQKQAQEDAQLAITRRAEDLFASLSDLAGRRDVAGFVGTRRQGEVDLARMNQDANIAQRRRIDEYLKQSQADKEEYDRRLAEMKAAAKDRIAQERQAGIEQINTAKTIEEELAGQRRLWQIQDEQRRRKQEFDNFRQRLKDLQDQQTALKPYAQGLVNNFLVSPVTNGLQSIAQYANNLFAGFRVGTALPQGRAVPTRHGGDQRIERTGLYLLEEGERVTSRSEARRGEYAGTNITLQIGAIGEVVTPSQLDYTVNRLVSAIKSVAGVA